MLAIIRVGFRNEVPCGRVAVSSRKKSDTYASSRRCSISSSARASTARNQIWFRAVDALADDEMLHRRLLAYVSDFFLLDTATLPHGTSFLKPTLIMASIDHALWFHRALRVDDWLLYAMESPSASGARGFARASVFARDGRLVASAAQEGLVRARKES